MATVCTGDEFDVDVDGKLILKICEPVPVTCCDNVLGRDPASGLYVTGTAAGNFEGAYARAEFGVSVSVGETENDKKSFTVENPSECLTACVFGVAEHVIEIGLDGGEAAYVVSATSPLIGTGPSRSLTLFNDGGSPRVYTTQVQDTFRANIAPGSSVTFYLNRGAEGIVGTSELVALTSGWRGIVVAAHTVV